MSRRNGFGPGYYRMLENTRLIHTHGVVDLINGGPFVWNSLEYGCGFGLNYPDNLDNYEEFDDDDDDDEYVKQNNRYCGFDQNFLDKGASKQLPVFTHFKAAKRITPEEATKNAKELVAEEEKLKKKAEKKKQKKLRQRERRRLEKLEKENGSKDGSKQDAAALPVQSKPTKRNCKNTKKTNIGVPPDPDPLCNSGATDSSDSCHDDDDDIDDDDDDDEKESLVDELELDMSSCFVTNAAAIAKRKLDQKPKSDKKDKKPENYKKPETAEKRPAKRQIKEASEESGKDHVTKSTELAVMGNKCAQIGNLDMAVEYFTDAIKHNPQEYKLFGNRSFCYEKMRQYEKALIDADIALSLNPTWIKGLYRKGKALVGLKRYYEASLIYKDVLRLDSSCTDAAQELMRVHIMQLMDMGYTKEQSSNALIIHGTIEKALEALSGLHGNMAAAQVHGEAVRVFPEGISVPVNVSLRTVSQNPPRVSTAGPTTPELFPVWVGDLVPAISESRLRELFSYFGPVHSVRLLATRRCAFVNYTSKEDCERAIQGMHGFRLAGACLVVRYPDRIPTHLGISRAAPTDAGKTPMFPNECSFWRTTGCIKDNRCSYVHVPNHKGIDRPRFKQ